MKKIVLVALSYLTALSCLLPFLAIFSSADVGDVNRLPGETSRTVEELTLSNGKKTGVRFTQINMNGEYGNKVVSLAEADLSDTHISIDVINSGEYTVSTATVANAVKTYRKTGKTVLAAINGDLWMTNVHSNESVTKKVLKVPRGVTIVDREVWSTEQIGMENYVATNAEQGTSSPAKAAFGVTADNQPLVGSPVISVKITDTTAGRSFSADGINRLPAWDSLIVYNRRVNSSNYALNDALEIELEADKDSGFYIGEKTTATVKAVYPSGSDMRPGIGEKTVILTARGGRIADLADISVGDKITFELSVTDRYGHTDLWQNVVTAIGGHMTAVLDGVPYTSLGGDEYPTSLIGYNDKGNVMLCTVTSPKEAAYQGLKFSQAYEFCKDIGYNSVFYLDGGGSTTMVTLNNGEYTVRNKCSDGTPREVINSVAIVWNDSPVCGRQGSLSYIRMPKDNTGVDPTRLDGKTISEQMSGQYQCTTSYDDGEKAMKMTAVGSSNNDPYATLSYSSFKKIYADDYPYLVIKIRSYREVSACLTVFFNLGARTGADANYCKSVLFDDGSDWQYLIFDFSGDSRWTGKINNFRLDMFDNTTMPKDSSMYFGAAALCKTRAEAENFIESDRSESDDTSVPVSSTEVTDTETVTETDEKLPDTCENMPDDTEKVTEGTEKATDTSLDTAETGDITSEPESTYAQSETALTTGGSDAPSVTTDIDTSSASKIGNNMTKEIYAFVGSAVIVLAVTAAAFAAVRSKKK